MSIHQHSVIEKRTKAKKGQGWVKTSYRKLSYRLCECGRAVRVPQRTCQFCFDERAEAKRNKICNVCEEPFRLEDHQNASVKVCPRCKDARYKVAFDTIMTFFTDNPPLGYLSLNKQIRNFSSIQRNVIQAVTMFPEFRISSLRFASVPSNSQTFDHVNAMTYFIEYYINDCVNNEWKRDFGYFREFLLKYAVQFRVTPAQNMLLAKYQANGITPEKYIKVVGPLKGKTKKESIEIIRPHFING